MTVYRLEYLGHGVFCGYAYNLMTNTLDAQYKQYGCTVVKARSDDNYRFACDSMEKLIEYFGSDFGKLLDGGAEIVCYKVHKAHVLFSMEDIEVAFKVDKAEKHIMWKG
jgi:hypothetical protein